MAVAVERRRRRPPASEPKPEPGVELEAGIPFLRSRPVAAVAVERRRPSASASMVPPRPVVRSREAGIPVAVAWEAGIPEVVRSSRPVACVAVLSPLPLGRHPSFLRLGQT
jgi:hypothetical protein